MILKPLSQRLRKFILANPSSLVSILESGSTVMVQGLFDDDFPEPSKWPWVLAIQAVEEEEVPEFYGTEYAPGTAEAEFLLALLETEYEKLPIVAYYRLAVVSKTTRTLETVKG